MKTSIQGKICPASSVGIHLGRRPALVGVLMAVCWFTLWAGSASARPDAYKEYEIKAVFLLNFTQFVEWPEGTFTETNTTLNIGVLGDEAFADTLQQTVNGERVKGRLLTIKRFSRGAVVKDCHVLFVSRSEESHLKELHDLLAGMGVLTVGECQDFSTCGGVINFFPQGSKIRFEINPDEARRKGLKISAQLLSLGKIVDSGSPKERH